jgi:hypothetical protein
MVSTKWLVDVSYNYGILLKRYFPLRCLKRFLFPFFALAIYKVFSERSTILTGFYICGTLEPKLKIYFFSRTFPSSLLPVLYFQQLPYVLWIKQGEILISIMDSPLPILRFRRWISETLIFAYSLIKIGNSKIFLLFLSIPEKPNRFIVCDW